MDPWCLSMALLKKLFYFQFHKIDLKTKILQVKNKRLYVAGQIAMIPATLQIINSGIRAEARLSIRHVERILLAMPGNASLQNISLVICYVTKRDYVAIAKEEWFRYNKVGLM